MSVAIDLNRGVVIQKHPTGMLVYMYCDTPGVYFTAHGVEVGKPAAKAAGYDTVAESKERLKRERMREAMTAIEVELELANSAEEETILWQRDGFRVVKSALGRADVYDDEDNKLNPMPIPEAEAKVLLDHLAPDKVKVGGKK